MTEKEVEYVRNSKRAGTLAENFNKMVGILQHVSSSEELEKIGYILSGTSIDEFGKSIKQSTRIALLSNFTIDSLKNLVYSESLSMGVYPETYLAGFNQYKSEILDRNSKLYQFTPDYTICLLDDRDLWDSLKNDLSRDSISTAFDDFKTSINSLVSTYTGLSNGHLIFNTIPFRNELCNSIVDYTLRNQIQKMIYELNYWMLSLESKENKVDVLDLNNTILNSERSFKASSTLSNYAEIDFNNNTLRQIAKSVFGIIRANIGLTKKCIILDLDNTLWGDIVGDVGPENIKLGNDFPGNTFMNFQKMLLRLKKQGVLLAVCSKNDNSVVNEVFDKNPNMILKKSDFVDIVANWDDKPKNIQTIQQQLNIGIDSLVFVDDSEFELNSVKEILPDVLTVKADKDVTKTIDDILNLQLFNNFSLTSEDKSRSEKYRTQVKRSKYQDTAESMSEYLHGLDMKVQIFSPNKYDMPRVTQLTTRTNQFNLTTIRCDEKKMEGIVKSDEDLLVAVKAEDKFGDYGIIGELICKIMDSDTLDITNYLMSCRVLSRGVEQTVFTELMKFSREKGFKFLTAQYHPTRKNKMVKNLYSKLGFETVNSTPNTTKYKFDLTKDEPLVLPDWITVQVNFGDELK